MQRELVEIQVSQVKRARRHQINLAIQKESGGRVFPISVCRNASRGTHVHGQMNTGLLLST